MNPAIGRAEWALHQRAALACAAARAAGVPGRFEVWAEGGALGVRATDPALSFLSIIAGVVPETGELGLVRAPDRLPAIRRLGGPFPETADVTEEGPFLDVLLAGYRVHGVVARFIRAEHGIPSMHRFLAVERGKAIGAAAMTIHEEVAVFGGASTLPEYRGRGAQSRLLRHRLRAAAASGCTWAVATARPDSVSAANLGRAGFGLHRRPVWRAPDASHGHSRA
ncbi:GNAT family N-acetyltransferase [Amycolatopsis magusensis]|uniref:GNAT family N-acetyltransferase n=1 Tax=Amycolatopsis magusensis TaxID=882444 RepID=UPI003C2D74C4